MVSTGLIMGDGDTTVDDYRVGIAGLAKRRKPTKPLTFKTA